MLRRHNGWKALTSMVCPEGSTRLWIKVENGSGYAEGFGSNG
jgi:hypothetical protein